MEKFDLRELNAYFKSNEDLRRFLEKTKHIILPDTSLRGVTTAYLLQAARGEILTIPKEKYKHFRGELQKRATKSEVHAMILQMTDKGTGFTEDNLPSKEWLLDCLYSLDENHPLFDTIEDKVSREFPPG